MIKKYSFQTEAQAKNLILKLVPTDGELFFNQITTTEITHAIVCNIRPSIKYDELGEPIIVEHLTYDVDVMWKAEAPIEWDEFEIVTSTPNHKFSGF